MPQTFQKQTFTESKKKYFTFEKGSDLWILILVDLYHVIKPFYDVVVFGLGPDFFI